MVAEEMTPDARVTTAPAEDPHSQHPHSLQSVTGFRGSSTLFWSRNLRGGWPGFLGIPDEPPNVVPVPESQDPQEDHHGVTLPNAKARFYLLSMG